MTWRQIKPELFILGENPDPRQAVVTLEYICDDSKLDLGTRAKAHIYPTGDEYYVLTQTVVKTIGGKDLNIPTQFWFWEAIEALKTLPHPSKATDFNKAEFSTFKLPDGASVDNV